MFRVNHADRTSLVFALFINLKNIGTGIFVMTRMVHKAIDLRQIVICRVKTILRRFVMAPRKTVYTKLCLYKLIQENEFDMELN